MAVDIFLKCDGIPGESKDSKHSGEIDILSWSWGQSQGGSFGAGGGGGSGKVQMQDVHFVAKASKASPVLMLKCAIGEHIKKSVLTMRKAGTGQQEFYIVTMTDGLVSSFQTGASNSGDDLPNDQFSINFAEILIEYKAQKADGSLDPAIKFGYNQSKNEKR